MTTLFVVRAFSFLEKWVQEEVWKWKEREKKQTTWIARCCLVGISFSQKSIKQRVEWRITAISKSTTTTTNSNKILQVKQNSTSTLHTLNSTGSDQAINTHTPCQPRINLHLKVQKLQLLRRYEWWMHSYELLGSIGLLFVLIVSWRNYNYQQNCLDIYIYIFYRFLLQSILIRSNFVYFPYFIYESIRETKQQK